MTDKRMPVKAWVAIVNGETLFIVSLNEEGARIIVDAANNNGRRAEVVPVTLTFGHESEAIRDAW